MSSARFNWEDPLLLDEQLGDDERQVRDAAREYFDTNNYVKVQLFPETGPGAR